MLLATAAEGRNPGAIAFEEAVGEIGGLGDAHPGPAFDGRSAGRSLWRMQGQRRTQQTATVVEKHESEGRRQAARPARDEFRL
jgi:hypothetical protein